MNERKFTPEEIVESLWVCGECGDGRCDKCAAAGQGLSACLAIFTGAAELIEAQAKRIVELEELVEDRTKDVLFYAEREKWISVTERLPGMDDGPIIVMEDYTAVLVLVMIEGTITATTLYCDVDDGYFFDMQGDEPIPYRVTHWKPMPKGPEVGHEPGSAPGEGWVSPGEVTPSQ